MPYLGDNLTSAADSKGKEPLLQKTFPNSSKMSWTEEVEAALARGGAEVRSQMMDIDGGKSRAPSL